MSEDSHLHPQRVEGAIIQCRLYHAIRAVPCEITLSHYHLFAMHDKYNPESCTFFTLIGEMGFALHEMFKVSRLSMGLTI